MNKVFKVIWSEARNAYVVVSEMAKSHGTKSCSTKKLLAMLIATGIMTCASMAPAMASNPASDDLNVTIGKGAHVSVWNGVTGKNITGDIAVGPNAHAWNGEYSYGSEGRIGSKEYLLDFGQGGVVGAESFFGIPYKYKVADGSKIAGSIAIGKNTVARTGSVMLGDHSYTGKLGDIEINPANAMTYNDGIYSTTLGAGAYNSGSLAAVTGALSIASGEDTQNTGATIYGSMNSIESATSNSKYSGVASSVLGFANRTQNANAALIWGTGNEVTNSVEKIGIDTDWNNVSVAEAQQKAIEAMQSSKYAGGSVMAIGGGNKADYATYSQLTGVQNKVTGTKAKAAKYDFVNGYQNTVTEASDVTVIGSKNEVTADGNKVIGDNHKVSGKNNVIFGSADKLTETTVNNAVVLGHNAKVTGEGGVALGVGSVADRANAVSVGSTGANRQIINVAAGEADTDAVNVSQLKKATANANKGWKLSTEGGTANQVASEATVDFSGKKDAGGHQNITVSNEGNNVKIELASELKNVTGVVNGNSRVTLGMNTAGISNGTAQMVIFNDGIYLSKPKAEQKDVQIHGVAAGEISSTSTDAINGSQLHQTNENVAQNKADIAQNKADIKYLDNRVTQNAADIAANKANIAQNAADIATNKANIAQNAADIAQNKDDIAQNKDDIAQNKADIKNVDNRVTNVEEVAKKHTTVTNGDNIVVSENTNADGGKEYKVALKNDIQLFGDNDAMVSISGSKGTIWASGSVAAGNVVMDGDTATVSGLSNKTTAYAGFATTGKAATEEQLKEVATEAGKHTQVKAGTNVSVVPSETADGTHVYTVNADGTTVSGDSNVVVTAGAKDANNVTNYGVKLNKDLQGIESVRNGGVKLALNGADGTAGLINGQGASIFMMNGSTTINGVVGIDNTGKISGVANGVADKDAVNVSQLKDVKAEAGKHTTLSDGKNTTVEATVKDGQTDYKVNVAGDLTDITSVINGGAKLALNGEAGVAGLINGKGASVYLQDGYTKINNKVSIDQDGKISGVAAGTADTDAVNLGQLKDVKAEAGKHTTLVAGDNVTLDKNETNKGLEYTVNAVDTKYTAGNGITIDAAANNAISVNLKEGEGNLVVDKDGLALNKDLQGIESISNNTSKLVLREGWAGMQNGVGASVFMVGGLTTINGKVTVDEQGKISGVAAGVADTDAVNVGQLKDVKAEAGKHTTLSNGKNTTVDAAVKDGQTDYKVNVAGDLTDISSVANGGAKLALDGAAGTAGIINGQGASVYMQGSTTVINSKVSVDKDGKISGVAAGKISADSTDAVNGSQLNAVATEAGKHSKVVNGNNTNVEETTVDGQKVYKVNLNNNIMVGDVAGKYVSISGTNGTIEATGAIATKDRVYADKGGKLADIDVTGNTISNGDAKLALNGAAGTAGIINGQGASVYMQGSTTVINSKVSVDKDGKISGVAAGTADTDAVNVSQLQKVSDTANAGWNLSTNGGEASKVAPGETVDFSGDKNISVSHDGTKVKVELNKDLDVNSVQTNALNSKYNLSVGTMAENGIMPFFVNSTGAFYAAHNKFSVDKDGNMNANSVQTNALNSKYNLSVGTANANGTVPFFVNSNGAFYAANNNFSVDKDGKVIATAGEIGNVVLNNGVYTGHSALRDGELFVGDASGNYSQITTKGAKLGKVTIAEDGKISGVAAGEVSSTSTDAINGSQLHQTNENVAALDKRVTQNEADIATNKANIAQNAADIAANKANIAQNAADIATNKANIAQNAADIAQNKADIAQNKADIAQNKADIAQNKTDIKNLDNRVTNVEELAKKHTTVTAGDNITVAEDTNKDGGKEYKVALDKDIKLDSVTTGQTVMNNDGLKVGDKVSVTKDAVTAGKTSISDEGVKVGDKTYISDNGLNANNKVITNVADGKENGDAVNYGQLKGVEDKVISNTNRINQLGSRVNKVGAGAAALAALHPMDFDPDDKLTFSAGYGNYAGENAAAIGAYYRPDEKVMFSVAGTVGNSENMVNAGVSFALDRTNHVSNSRTALAREVIDLRGQLAVMGAKMAKMEKAFGMLDETKTKLFPDVPANHWAYEYIAKLAGNGYIEGYPDGNFGGDRLMTRYEFAAMLYRAIENGAALEEKIIKEFEPELGRIRVDRISGEDGDRDKIERVRVNDTKGERDHYGNKLAK